MGPLNPPPILLLNPMLLLKLRLLKLFWPMFPRLPKPPRPRYPPLKLPRSLYEPGVLVLGCSLTRVGPSFGKVLKGFKLGFQYDVDSFFCEAWPPSVAK
jgi:hypothetical protein